MKRMGPSISSGGQSEQKLLLRGLLLERNLDVLICKLLEHKGALRMLNVLLYDCEEIVGWRAVEAFGRIAAAKAEVSLEGVREMIRRLLWAMNDESGSSVAHAPELMGEIIAQVPSLISEFSHRLTVFHDLAPYKRGVHWAMARVAHVARDTFADFTAVLSHSLESPDPLIRGLALRTLSLRTFQDSLPLIRTLAGDRSALRYYDTSLGDFRCTTVSRIASELLEDIRT